MKNQFSMHSEKYAIYSANSENYNSFLEKSHSIITSSVGSTQEPVCTECPLNLTMIPYSSAPDVFRLTSTWYFETLMGSSNWKRTQT